MTKHTSSSAPPSPAINSSPWSDFAIQDAVANLPHNSGAAAIAQMMKELAITLSRLRDWEKWDPRTMESIVSKSGYQVVETLEPGGRILCLQALPDGRIVSGSGDWTLRIWDGSPLNGGSQ